MLSPYPLLFRVVVMALGFVFATTRSAAADPAEFRSRLAADLQRAVERAHAGMARAREAKNRRADRGYANVLSGMIDLHAATGDAKLLQWAKDDLLWTVESAIQEDGKARAFLTSFRNLPPFCTAYMYLKARNVFSADEIKKIDDQIAASAASHYDYTDFGAQNRGLIDGAAFHFAAKAVPDAANVEKWRRYGDALAYDSWNQWSIEDASIYQPFWLNYTLQLAELLGTTEQHMKSITTRYYFDYPKALLMPNGLLPDWGDGDWTHMWSWSVANLVRAGSYYKDGEYLEAARRLYVAACDYWKELDGDAIYCVGMALRWLDPNVPFQTFTHDKSHEAIDDLISKKIVFRNGQGAYGMLTYRDEGPFARYQRDYLNAQLFAFEEKPHHGHADENSIALLMDGDTVLLADGGYRRSFTDGWRGDVYHNRIVARTGFPSVGDMFAYMMTDTSYHAVHTEKIHFGNFGSLDYSRTRLVDSERGYTADRILLFVPETGLYIVVDSILIDTPGPKLFANTWHPASILSQGDNYVVSWPGKIPIRREYWPNQHNKDLLIQFLGNRDKVAETKEIDRRFNPSQTFYQHLRGFFFKGQRLTFATVLRPHNPDSFNPEMLNEVGLITNAADDGRTLGLQFKINGEPVVVGLKLDQTIGLTNLRGRPMFDFKTGAVKYGELQTDADFAFVRLRKDGAKETGLVYGCSVAYAGEVLFDMPLNRHMYQGPGDFRVAQVKDKMPRYHLVIPPLTQRSPSASK